MRLVLTREPASWDCSLGVLDVDDLKLVTMERPWVPSTTCKGGAKGISCVPKGIYKLVRHDSPKHPKTWALVNHDLDVVHYEGDDKDPDEDRATCLIHPANFATQLQGCIAPGTRVVKIETGFMVVKSREAMDLLRAKLPWTDDHSLEIR